MDNIKMAIKECQQLLPPSLPIIPLNQSTKAEVLPNQIDGEPQLSIKTKMGNSTLSNPNWSLLKEILEKLNKNKATIDRCQLLVQQDKHMEEGYQNS